MLPLLMLLAKGNSLLANIHDKNNLKALGQYITADCLLYLERMQERRLCPRNN